jgi:phospholipid/cholesterol/gamma-HCH transport system ATP-binding protein
MRYLKHVHHLGALLMTLQTGIQLRGVCKAFDGQVVLDNVNLSVPVGKTTSIIGQSGCGKSVLVKLVLGLLTADKGEIHVDGIRVDTEDQQALQTLRKRFGVLFQHGALFSSMSAGENIDFPLSHHTSLSISDRRAKVNSLLELVELPSIYDVPVGALSGGQQKRVALARAIALEPDYLFFDEPNSGLDPLTSDTIDSLITRMKIELGITFIVITHDIISAINISDTIAMLSQGQVIEHCDARQFASSQNPRIKMFLARNRGFKAL